MEGEGEGIWKEQSCPNQRYYVCIGSGEAQPNTKQFGENNWFASRDLNPQSP